MNLPKTFIIAEIGQAHDGSLGIAHSYIDEISKTGVDAIKFQTHIAIAESSKYEPFRVKFSYEDKTRYDYWKRMEFSLDQWKGLKKHCLEKGLEFISSPFSNAAVDLLEKLNVKKYKIGSGEVSNLLLLEKIARTRKQVILSSGMSNLAELDVAINFFKESENHVSLLQCTTAYPTLPGEWSLKSIPLLKKRYKVPVGFSDHSGKINPSIAAVTLGAEIIEVHATFNKNMFGPDSKASLLPKEIKHLVDGVRDLEIDFKNSNTKEIEPAIEKVKKIFEKSLSINRDLKKGEVITFEILEAKKPKGYGIDAYNFKDVLGKKVKKNMKAFSFLNHKDLY